MVKLSGTYEGDLRCKLIHEDSGTVIYTDAPKDNMGKGELFSPTDLVGAALSSCILTVMAITANRHQIELKGTRVNVVKEMAAAPARMIASIEIAIYMPKGIPIDKRLLLENAAHTCPVHRSLHPDIKISIIFHYE